MKVKKNRGRREYSQFTSPSMKQLVDILNNHVGFQVIKKGRNLSEGDFNVMASLLYDESHINREGLECGGILDVIRPLAAMYAQLLTTFLWEYRPCQHYFLAPGVADFCISSVKEITPFYANPLPACPLVSGVNHSTRKFVEPIHPLPYFKEVPVPITAMGANYRPILCDNEGVPLLGLSSFNPDVLNKRVQGGFAIHFPKKEKRASLFVVPGIVIPYGFNDKKNSWLGDTTVVEKNRILLQTAYASIIDDEHTLLVNPDSSLVRMPPDHFKINMAKVVLGLSLYMSVYPEVVVKTGWNEIACGAFYKGDHKHSVGRHPIIDSEDHNARSPHWRRGHFRLLGSDRYINKKGQVVFVKGSFVKGIGYDVLNREEKK